jgi:hypothetical protein
MVAINVSFQKLLLPTWVLPIVGLDIGTISSGNLSRPEIGLHRKTYAVY